jgi:flagellar biogenesis protein FliO
VNNLKSNLLIAASIITFNIYADDVSVKSLDLKQANGIGLLSIKTTGNLTGNPELKVVGKTIELKLPNAHTNKISKKIGEVLLTSSQVDRSTVKVVASFAGSLVGKEALINVTLKDGSVDLNFPSIENKMVPKLNSKISRAPSIVDEKQMEAINKEAEKLDENYLQNLEKEHQKVVEAKQPLEIQKNTLDVVKDNKESLDRVKLSQSSVLKEATKGSVDGNNSPKSSFSIAGYIGKFVAFLAIMLLGFYGVLTLFKKGVIKKGKLGFLHSTKLVEVLSTTHIAPKKTLMMVKAHKQVFLISSTETGIQLISEIADVSGLIKTGEAEITGSNFDTNLNKASAGSKEFKIKEEDYVDYESLDEMLNEPPMTKETLTSAAKAIEKKPIKDTVRFSDQIKSKVKNLKQLS